MGRMFAFASITFFFKLMPQPELTGDMKIFMDGIEASVYLITTLKVFELLSALAFLSGRFVPLAAVVIFPINVNILFVHIFLDPSSLLMAVLLILENLFLAYYYRDKYAGILSVK